MKIKPMPNNDPNNYGWLCQFIAAIAGGAAKIAFDVLSGKSFTLKIIICQLIVAVYAGQVAAWLANIRGWQDDEKILVISLSAWLGAELIKALADNIKFKSGGK